MPETLSDVMREIIGDRTQRDIALASGVNQTTIHNMLRGQHASIRLTELLADRLNLSPSLRRRLMVASGHLNPLEGVLDDVTLDALGGAYDLPPDDLEELNAMVREDIAERRRKLGME